MIQNEVEALHSRLWKYISVPSDSKNIKLYAKVDVKPEDNEYFKPFVEYNENTFQLMLCVRVRVWFSSLNIRVIESKNV